MHRSSSICFKKPRSGLVIVEKTRIYKKTVIFPCTDLLRVGCQKNIFSSWFMNAKLEHVGPCRTVVNSSESFFSSTANQNPGFIEHIVVFRHPSAPSHPLNPHPSSKELVFRRKHNIFFFVVYEGKVETCFWSHIALFWILRNDFFPRRLIRIPILSNM